VLSLATGDRRCLAAPPAFADSGDSAPTVSPDGQIVAFFRTITLGHDEIYTVPVAGGDAAQVTHDGHSIGQLMWSPDGRYIIFSSGRAGFQRTWRVPIAGGPIEPEPTYRTVGALNRDGQRLAFADGSGLPPSIWRADLSSPGGKPASIHKILDSSGGNDSPQFSPDGKRIVFRSSRSGTADVWRIDADGGDALQLTLTNQGFAGTPRWSPDGKWIVFDSRDVHSCIHVVDTEGRNRHAVVSGNYENVVPSWSRDGRAIYFSSNRTGSWQVWKHELSTGKETQLTRHGGLAALESYDEKTLYYSKMEGGGLWRVPVAGGAEQHLIDSPRMGYWGHFAVTEGGIYVLDVNSAPRPSIEYFDFRTRRLAPVLEVEEFPLPWTANLAASRDGMTILFTQFVPQSSIEMVENLR
jgi:Tol biopolymer transport system component